MNDVQRPALAPVLAALTDTRRVVCVPPIGGSRG